MKTSVYTLIKNMIFTQQIKCGEKISEHQIAKELEVSRTPVREAIKRLADEGLINIYPNRYAEVVTYDEKAVVNLATARIALDTLAVKLAVLYGNNCEFMDLKDYAERCIEAAEKKDLLSRIHYDAQFHLMLTGIGKNDVLHRMQYNLQQRVILWQTTTIKAGDEYLGGLHDHVKISLALFDRDLDQLIPLVQGHLFQFYRHFLSNANKRSVLQITELEQPFQDID